MKSSQPRHEQHPVELMRGAPEGANAALWAVATGPLDPSNRASESALRIEYDSTVSAIQSDIDQTQAIDPRDRGARRALDDQRTRSQNRQTEADPRVAHLRAMKEELGNEEVRLKRGAGRRVLGAISVGALLAGGAASALFPHDNPGLVVKDDSILPGSSNSDIAPGWLDPIVPPGIDDQGLLTSHIEVVPVEPGDIATDSDQENPDGVRYTITVRTDSASTQAQNQHAPDFKLTGTEREADAAAAEAFVDELQDVLVTGGTIEDVSVTGLASDEAAGEETGTGILNPENLDLAKARAQVADEVLNEAISAEGLEAVLPATTQDAREIVLTPEQISEVDGIATELGITRKVLINDYLKGSVKLNNEQLSVMEKLYDENRGPVYEATVHFEDQVTSPDGELTGESQEPSTKTVTTKKNSLFLGGNGEFFAALLAANPALIASYIAFSSKVNATGRIARMRARRELKRQGFELPKH